MPRRAFISLGSNLDPEVNLPAAATRALALGKFMKASQVYQNPAIAPSPQPDYLNGAFLIATELEPLEIRRQLRRIERELGRVRTADKYAARPIDLDLCLLEDLIIEEDDLTLPDPDLLVRPHLAVTVAELDPEFRHPVSGERLGEIAARLRPRGRLTPRPDVQLVPQGT